LSANGVTLRAQAGEGCPVLLFVVRTITLHIRGILIGAAI